MAGECDRPKKDDRPPTQGTSKGDKGKSDKGKSKGKLGDAGKGKAQIQPLVEASETSGAEGRQLKQQDSDPKEPDAEPQKALSEFAKLVIKAFKEKEKVETSPNTIEDFESIIDTLKSFNT